ncbi:TonB-dependent receptor [Granulicella sp. 5B5]|uniref:TonB-dependent receptor n=1 Tax=Granulicella sp. 5B5 TaxID=1617967 RepID=UPI0015F4E3E5|nr:TonB-dependent receptor [Granulicella sp. 5B5]QMV19198.1 TonB-dependent receptor [Granulicella sp. 5B5]
MRLSVPLAVLVLSPLTISAQTPQSTTTLARPSSPPTAHDTITVTADRGLPGITDSATSVATLSSQQLQQASGLTLDDRLHSVAGFQLFRRTSSWTANPTTEGISLRGLGSTAASRTLVESGQVPLNDPFGGWIHWDEIPTLAIQQVELLRGGSADLYGSSAIGGVIAVEPLTPSAHSLTLAADTAGATENSALGDLLLTTTSHALSTLGAFSALSTGGYISTAPAFRGTVDIPSNVFQQSGRLAFFTPPQTPIRAFLLGNILNESRGNGTPLQTNGTRLWRYLGGLDADTASSHESLRLFGSRESYRQSFSAIAANRNSETLTKLHRIPTDELGLVAQASHTLASSLTAALGFDLHDIRATADETATATAVTTSISARQRETGGYLDAIWQPKHWSLSGSIRIDSFRTLNAQQTASNTPSTTPLPELDELFASPHLGIVRTLPHNLALTANAFRAFRGPTMNELYSTGQVGQQITLANNSLLAERATGFEFGGEYAAALAHIRATYFWTEVNRPISAVELSQTPTTQLLQRQNLGQIRSRGLMLEAQTARWHSFDTTFGYQFAIATVTAFNSSSPAQANLTGNWIPEVPRESFTATANYAARAGNSTIANLHLIASYTGHTYDDAANQFLLHPYARFDLSADRSLTHGLSIYASAQNLLNRTIDAGRTPILTLAAPRLVQAGLRYTFSR